MGDKCFPDDRVYSIRNSSLVLFSKLQQSVQFRCFQWIRPMHAHSSQHLFRQFGGTIPLNDKTNVYREGTHVTATDGHDAFRGRAAVPNVQRGNEQWLLSLLGRFGPELIRDREFFTNNGGSTGDHISNHPRAFGHIGDQLQAFILIVGIPREPLGKSLLRNREGRIHRFLIALMLVITHVRGKLGWHFKV